MSRARALLDRCDRAESGTGPLVRLRLRARGVRVRPQVPIESIARVDRLIGDRLIIEAEPDLVALIRRDAHVKAPTKARYKVAARPI